jgi:hypothetical protein
MFASGDVAALDLSPSQGISYSKKPKVVLAASGSSPADSHRIAGDESSVLDPCLPVEGVPCF